MSCFPILSIFSPLFLKFSERVCLLFVGIDVLNACSKLHSIAGFVEYFDDNDTAIACLRGSSIGETAWRGY